MGKGARQRAKRKQEQDDFKLTRPQKKAAKKEIKAQILETDRAYYLDMDAAVLWTLHKRFGFGRKRLREFFEAFADSHDELCKYYELDEDDNGIWLCRKQLKDYGVDVEAWEKEYEENAKRTSDRERAGTAGTR